MDTPTRRLAYWIRTTRRRQTAPLTVTVRSTRRRRTALLVIALTAITGGLAPMDARAHDDRTQTRTQRYLVGDVGPFRDPLGQALTFPSCSIKGNVGPVRLDATLGSLCFGSTVGDTFTVEITDDSGRTVGGIVIIEAGSGRIHRHFCGSSGPLPAVRGSLYVHLDAPGDVRGKHDYGGPGCTEIRPLGTSTGATTQGATSGRVQVTFTRHDR